MINSFRFKVVSGPDEDTTSPSDVPDFAATQASSDIQLSWNEATDNESIVEYDIQYQVDSGTWTVLTSVSYAEGLMT